MNGKSKKNLRRQREKRLYIITGLSYLTVLTASLIVFWNLLDIGNVITFPKKQSADIIQPVQIPVYKISTLNTEREKGQPLILKEKEKEPEKTIDKNLNASKQSGLEQALDELIILTDGE